MVYDTLGTFFTGMAAGTATIHLNSGGGAVALLLPIMLGLTIVGIVGVARVPVAWDSKGAKTIICAALIMLLLALAVPWGLVIWADDTLTVRGYIRCPASGRPSRFPSADFVRPRARCGMDARNG